MERIDLDGVRGVLDELSYPLSRPAAAEALQGTTLEHEAGTADLGALVSETASDGFDSAEELLGDLLDVVGGDVGEGPGEIETGG